MQHILTHKSHKKKRTTHIDTHTHTYTDIHKTQTHMRPTHHTLLTNCILPLAIQHFCVFIFIFVFVEKTQFVEKTIVEKTQFCCQNKQNANE